jgi:formylglycine-generating enzyme
MKPTKTKLKQTNNGGATAPIKEAFKKECCTPFVRSSRVKQGRPVDCHADEFWKARCIFIRGGETVVGTQEPKLPQDGESPPRKVRLKPFLIDPFCVTNKWFAEFVDSTGYVTDAERYGWSLVFWSFTNPEGQYQRVRETPWWCKVDGAMWAKPNGPESSIENLADHPVTHVSWNDASAFARWASARLPTEAEWESAARGDISEAIYPWGEDEPTDEHPLCNIWQGEFPQINTVTDGYAATAPVASFAENSVGTFNMVGNVWEWCADSFMIRSQRKAARLRNSASRANGDRLVKGGSYLCHKSYCYRYRIAARTGVSADTSAGHTGFRLVV